MTDLPWTDDDLLNAARGRSRSLYGEDEDYASLRRRHEQFALTTIARAMFAMFKRARFLNSNGLFTGAAALGKTFAAALYADTVPKTYMVTVTPDSGKAALWLFRQLGEMVLGGYAIRGTSLRDVENQLYKCDLAGHLLIVDEAQNLKNQAARHIQYLNDEARMAIVFCGNKEVLDSAKGNTPALEQILTRISTHEHVDVLDDEDAVAIARTFGVDGDDAFALMRGVAAGPRRARGIVDVLKAARAIVGPGKPIKANHIRDAQMAFPQYRPASAKR